MKNGENNQRDITIKKSMIENREALSEIAPLLDIKDGESLEGYIGAIYLYHGGFESVKKCIINYIVSELNKIGKEKYINWIGLVKEILDKKKDHFADYRLCEGYSETSPPFRFDLYINQELIERGEEDSDKTSARQNVSKKAYEKIRDKYNT